MSKLLPKLILLLIMSFCLLGLAGSGVATVKADSKPINFNPNVTIPNSDFEHEDPSKEDAGKPLTRDTKPIADYIKAIYTYAISIVAIAAALALMVGGTIWLTAGGSNTRVENAKKIMTGALSGLVLALGSYFLLAQINPELTKTQWFAIDGVQEDQKKDTNEGPGCCQYVKPGLPAEYKCSPQLNETACKNKIPQYFQFKSFYSGTSCIGGKCTSVDKEAECNAATLLEPCDNCKELPCHCVKSSGGGYRCDSCKVVGEKCRMPNDCCGNLDCKHGIVWKEAWKGAQWTCQYK